MNPSAWYFNSAIISLDGMHMGEMPNMISNHLER